MLSTHCLLSCKSDASSLWCYERAFQQKRHIVFFQRILEFCIYNELACIHSLKLCACSPRSPFEMHRRLWECSSCWFCWRPLLKLAFLERLVSTVGGFGKGISEAPPFTQASVCGLWLKADRIFPVKQLKNFNGSIPVREGMKGSAGLLWPLTPCQHKHRPLLWPLHIYRGSESGTYIFTAGCTQVLHASESPVETPPPLE